MINLRSNLKKFKQFIPASIIRQKLDMNNSILFSFDDGPHAEITPRVLDCLDKYCARGLFFIPACRIINAPKLIKEILSRGHSIGNHSFTHTLVSQLSYQEIKNEINACKNELFLHCGFETSLYRPPQGIITPSLIVAAWRCRHKIVRWSFDSGEYSYMRGAVPSDLADNFLNNIHDRAIVLSHDDKETTPDFLKLVLPRLVERGIDLKNGLHSLVPFGQHDTD